MRARNLTLTGIGLPVRAELRLKSLLEVINSKTTDRWSFVEHADAHVAICDPASALSSVTMRRGASGATRFFSLVEDVSLAAAGTSVIRDPIRASDLIELLESCPQRMRRGSSPSPAGWMNSCGASGCMEKRRGCCPSFRPTPLSSCGAGPTSAASSTRRIICEWRRASCARKRLVSGLRHTRVPTAESEPVAPCLPRTDLPGGMIWPPVEGRLILHEATMHLPSLRQEADGEWRSVGAKGWWIQSHRASGVSQSLRRSECDARVGACADSGA